MMRRTQGATTTRGLPCEKNNHVAQKNYYMSLSQHKKQFFEYSFTQNPPQCLLRDLSHIFVMYGGERK
jgi:hypothetical protein